MAKQMLTREDADKASQEVLDILRSISAVRGRPYAAAVRGIFAMSNFLEAVAPAGAVFKDSEMQSSFKIMCEAHLTSLYDLSKTLIDFLVSPREGEELAEYNKRWNSMAADINKDVLALYNKQNEYGAAVFGTGS